LEGERNKFHCRLPRRQRTDGGAVRKKSSTDRDNVFADAQSRANAYSIVADATDGDESATDRTPIRGKHEDVPLTCHDVGHDSGGRNHEVAGFVSAKQKVCDHTGSYAKASCFCGQGDDDRKRETGFAAAADATYRSGDGRRHGSYRHADAASDADTLDQVTRQVGGNFKRTCPVDTQDDLAGSHLGIALNFARGNDAVVGGDQRTVGHIARRQRQGGTYVSELGLPRCDFKLGCPQGLQTCVSRAVKSLLHIKTSAAFVEARFDAADCGRRLLLSQSRYRGIEAREHAALPYAVAYIDGNLDDAPRTAKREVCAIGRPNNSADLSLCRP
jgi:hypothetical protein